MGFAQEHNPHNMTADWQSKDPSTWNIYQKFIDAIDITPIIPGKPPPVFAKTDKMPFMAQWSQHLFIITYAAIPLLLHQAYVSLTGQPLSKAAVIFLYNLAYVLVAVREVRMLRRLTYKFGCLDGDVADRDGIPNSGGGKIIGEMHKTAGFRIIMATWIAYEPGLTPLAFFSKPDIWAPLVLKLALYGPILDFFFYTYHRACHEVPWLWKYHRTHHLNKHPTALHSGFADDEQEIIEIVIVPFLTYATLWALGLKLNFYEWWVCFEYVTYSEIFGHSGLRIYGTVPSPITPVLSYLGMELVLEDHDLHHRRGWKKSFNYGKQTRVWDRIFGTCTDRIEAKPDNVDFSNKAHMPLF
ncbi:hypothetical protein MY5147_007622 [Beauveria neobassiana]|uniref:Fatty acid hydroxylase domain-containing protein n=2 Tax=Beauveria bassiana TaxID=176275 RepID=A0A0A2VIN4_BEABA|nr:hypothetical protein BBAD15_g6970 [Beauveria bassiana D1-5]PQK09190.1 hypothetical protein BB8028_0001g12610 [Beauveria bassiana]